MSTSSIANTVYLQDLLKKELQFFYDRNTIMTKFANRDFEGNLKQEGDTVSIQEFPNLLFDIGTSADATGAITASTYATAKHDLVVNKVGKSRVIVPDLEDLRENFDSKSKLLDRMAYAISQMHEKHIGLVAAVGAGTSINASSPIALTVSNIAAQLSKFGTALEDEDISANMAGAFVDPKTYELLARATELITTDKAVEIIAMDGAVQKSYVGEIKTGFTGAMVNGVRLYKTNNLPHKQTLTIDTNGIAGDTITVTVRDPRKKSNETRDVTITWTCRANGAAAAAGDISIGAGGTALADFQASIVNALNGTGTAGASNYIEISADNRKLLKWNEFSISSFGSNVATIYANNKITLAETLTAATNIFGTAARGLLCFAAKSVNFVDQLTKMKVTDATDGFYGNVLSQSVYQGAVLGQNKYGVVVNWAQYLSL